MRGPKGLWGVTASGAFVTMCFASSSALAQGTTCAPRPGAVVASEGRGGFGARLVASPRGVAVTWVENAPWGGDFSGQRGSAQSYYGRVFDPATLAARGPGVNTMLQDVPYAVPMGPVALARADGALHGLDCMCVGGAARFACALHDLASGGVASERIRPDNRQTSVCPIGALSATVVGGDVLAAVPFPDVNGVRMHGTAVGALQNVALDEEVQVPAMAALGNTEAVFVRRSRGVSIVGQAFDVRGNARGRPMVLSTGMQGTAVGAPFVLSQGASVLVAYAQRLRSSPWRIQFVQWAPGTDPVRTEIDTGREAAMAPSLAQAENGCVVLSWTQGSGRTTVAYAGRVCNGRIEAGTIAPISQAGVEAGDSEVASSGGAVYAVWQEIPAGRGARAELRLARLGCR